MNANPSFRPATLCIHEGTYVDAKTGGVNTPIFTSTAYAYPNPANENIYPRYFNVPNQRVIARKLAALEHGEDALVFGSGMAAISTLLFAYLKPGDHAVFQGDIYGGTYHFVATELKEFGVQISFARTLDQFRAELRSNTRVLYIESPSNPLLRCIEVSAIAAIARDKKVLSIIDNTFATPINQTPLQLGIDVVLHSGTKYLNGHSDVNSGVIVGSRKVIEKLIEYATNHGGMLDSQACYQLERGLKTLALRVRQHNQNAAELAAFLKSHKAVTKVHYPGLETDPHHAVAARQMLGFGGMLSFELTNPARVDAVLKAFQIVRPALSLGGVESLVTVPSRTSHRTMSPAEREAAGISDGLIRVSVGIEDIDDIREDFSKALAAPA